MNATLSTAEDDSRCARSLLHGEILLYPTDTLYGLGVDATNPQALRRLQELKGRPDGKPISIVVSSIEMMKEYAMLTPLGEKLAEKFLPGALTLVLQAKSNVPSEITAGTGTVGIRIPKKENILKMVREFGKPITATSANGAGMKPERAVEQILVQFGERGKMIAQIIDEGVLPESLPSTIVDARGVIPIILRSGAISDEEIISPR